ncbi:MAG: hypothetical protein O3A46_14670, partial [Candidatus Poribacteria bacterium]|nr:hypothetical protein [Candidatus Poribacteria bacterium]
QDWEYHACPMDGPDLFSDGDALHIAWRSKDDVYSSAWMGDYMAGALTPMSEKKDSRVYPLVMSNAGGDRVFVWVEGNEVRYENVSRTGHALHGPIGAAPYRSRPAGFVAPDGTFLIVTDGVTEGY